MDGLPDERKVFSKSSILVLCYHVIFWVRYFFWGLYLWHGVLRGTSFACGKCARGIACVCVCVCVSGGYVFKREVRNELGFAFEVDGFSLAGWSLV